MKSILVIDDNADIRENTAEILELAGYNVITAENGKKGVDAALKEKTRRNRLRHNDART